jgi:hypothetical protein
LAAAIFVSIPLAAPSSPRLTASRKAATAAFAGSTDVDDTGAGFEPPEHPAEVIIANPITIEKSVIPEHPNNRREMGRLLMIHPLTSV